MDEKLVCILNEMADYLNIAQMKKLQEVLLKNLTNDSPQKEQVSNEAYLKMFIDAKRIEGCSDRTLQYYNMTVEHLLATVDVPVRKMTTDEIRSYLADYQQRNNCSKVTVDNVRRNISSFFSWLEEEDYILKLTDMPFEEMFQISKEPRDAFDVHAGAFETACMREIYPEAVRENTLAMLEPTFL